jgi:hypothetical protein
MGRVGGRPRRSGRQVRSLPHSQRAARTDATVRGASGVRRGSAWGVVDVGARADGAAGRRLIWPAVGFQARGADREPGPDPVRWGRRDGGRRRRQRQVVPRALRPVTGGRGRLAGRGGVRAVLAGAADHDVVAARRPHGRRRQQPGQNGQAGQAADRESGERQPGHKWGARTGNVAESWRVRLSSPGPADASRFLTDFPAAGAGRVGPAAPGGASASGYRGRAGRSCPSCRGKAIDKLCPTFTVDDESRAGPLRPPCPRPFRQRCSIRAAESTRPPEPEDCAHGQEER